MKLVRNRTRRPLKIRLPGGKVLHLGPLKTGQVADDAVDQRSIRELLEADEIEIVGEGQVETAADTAPSPRTSTHGHHQPTVVMPKGNR